MAQGYTRRAREPFSVSLEFARHDLSRSTFQRRLTMVNLRELLLTRLEFSSISTKRFHNFALSIRLSAGLMSEIGELSPNITA
jgi:hypothetical protein